MLRAPTTEHRLRALSRRMHAPHWIVSLFALCILLIVLDDLYERLAVLASILPHVLDNSPGVTRLIWIIIGTTIVLMFLLALLCILCYIYVMRQNAGMDSALYKIAGEKARLVRYSHISPLRVTHLPNGQYEVEDGARIYTVSHMPHKGLWVCHQCHIFTAHKDCQHVAAVKREQQHRRLKTVQLVPEQKKASSG